MLAGALASVAIRAGTTAANSLAAPIFLVLYPLSAVIGYDLAAGERDTAGGALERLGGYAIAIAAAHVAIALSVAICVAAHVDGDSSLWYVLYAPCVVAAGPARAAALRLGRGFSIPGGALVGASLVILVLAWLTFFVAMGAYMTYIDA